MKDKLTIEQSQELIDVGVLIKEASEVYVIEGFSVTCYRPCFTLLDVLDILPSKLVEKGDSWPLTIKHHDNNLWSAGYGQIIMMLEKELIDAAFGLIKWHYNKYINPISNNEKTV